MTENQMAEFWNTIKNAHGKELQKLAEDTLTRFSEAGESYALGGTFEPLTYWKAQGYDIDRIERLTPEHDKEEHPILGTTYRIHKHSTSTWGHKGDRRSETVGGALALGDAAGVGPTGNKRITKLRQHSGKRIKAICDGEPDEDADVEGVAPRDGSTSSSSSSSSSSNDKHKKSKKSKDKKKKKQDKLAKKEKDKAAARIADEKKNKKVADQAVKCAQLVIVKTGPTKARLADLFSSAGFLDVPAVISDPIKEWAATINKYVMDANKVLKDEGKGKAQLPDLKDVCKVSLVSSQIMTCRLRHQAAMPVA